MSPAAGDATRITLTNTTQLASNGGSLVLAAPDNTIIHKFQYLKSQVKIGRTIVAAN